MKDQKYFILKDGLMVSNSFKVNMIHPKEATMSTVPQTHPTRSQKTKSSSLPKKKEAFIAPINGSMIFPICTSVIIKRKKR